MYRERENGYRTGQNPMVTRTLTRGLDILETLATADETGLSLSAIAETVSLDKATVSRLLFTLAATGYVTQNENTRRYRLTAKILRVAHQGVATRLDLLGVARPYLRTLLDQYNETVYLGIMQDLRVVHIDRLESTNPIQLVCAVGQTLPLHSTALGKAMLSALPEVEREEKMARLDFAPKTERSIHDAAEFREEIRRIRRRGYAVDDRESEPAGACVAAAIMGTDARPAGAISISGPHFRIRDHFEALGRSVNETAAAITADLGVTTGPHSLEG
jgi:DNA-binding IclR family transcriptional regulator